MQANVVIIGSGIVGSALALHLARLGWDGIVVVDKGPVVHNDGSTSHAPGGVVALSHSKLLTRMGHYGADLHASLPQFDPGRRTVNRVGGLELAISERRMMDLRRLAGEAKSYHAGARLLDTSETIEFMPHMDPSMVEGSLFVESSQLVASPHLNGALQQAAGDGVTWLAHTEITDVTVSNGHVTGVTTANPDVPSIEAEQVVICTNIWGPILGDRVGVPIPLHAYDHQYLISPPLAELSQFDPGEPDDEVTFPTIRELDTFMYYRQHWNAYGIGSYRHRPRRVESDRLGTTAMNPFRMDDFLGTAWETAQKLFPFFRGLDPSDFPTRFNGMFAFSVDGMPIIGEARTKGLWVATASWLTHAAGVAKMTSEMMSGDDPEWDPRAVDLHRFHGFQTTPAYLATVCDKNYAEVYDIVHPLQPMTRPRNVRRSPFHDRHQVNDAVFTTFAGIELPNWYASNADLVERYADRIPPRSGWAAEHWSPIQGAEHLATRDRAGIFDLHGLSIIELRGGRAVELADYLCSNRVGRAVGSLTYTTWLTPSGGVRRDLVVGRMAPDRMWCFVGEGTRPRDLHWVETVAERGGFDDVAVIDASDAWSAVGLWGPNARAILQRVTSTDVGNDSFPYFTSQVIDVGMAEVVALRLSYAGELGWELHMPTDAALTVWDALVEAGVDLDLVPAGMGAFDSLRLEKGYPAWGADVHTEYTPWEAGLGWAVRPDKGDFVGRDACLGRVGAPPDRRWSCLALDSGVVFGYEPILSGEECVGYVTSGNFGYSVQRSLAYGYLPPNLAVPGTSLEVEFLGERIPATVIADPPFDPEMSRLKG